MDPAHDDQILFERLLVLRELYRRRGDQDRFGVASIDDAARHAIDQLESAPPSSAQAGAA
jgi:hypothetical protein